MLLSCTQAKREAALRAAEAKAATLRAEQDARHAQLVQLGALLDAREQAVKQSEKDIKAAHK